ncbi:MAG TPA: hypothetical protein VLB84_06310, partial [Bacteroidia bacterium]|nr:hypothetical protein [Bacteroidia bacterium]
MKKANRFISINRLTILMLALSAVSFISCKSKKGIADSTPVEKTSTKELSEKSRVEFEHLFFDGAREKLLGNYDLAETRFLQALRVDPTSAATMYELGTIYTYQNNKNQALFYSKKAAIADPKNIWYQLLYAECLKEKKQMMEVVGV